MHGVADLAMGGAHTLALRHTDNMMAWGANQNGVLGLGIGVSRDAKEPVNIPKLTCSQVVGCLLLHHVQAGVIQTVCYLDQTLQALLFGLLLPLPCITMCCCT